MYTSKSTKQNVTEQLYDIINVAVPKNKALGITGFLVEFNGTFVQVLEGDRNKVLNLYFKVEQDPGHKDVTLLEYQVITERRWPRWNMASSQLSLAEAERFAVLEDFIKARDFDQIEDILLEISRLKRC
jgi:hypothetical protein